MAKTYEVRSKPSGSGTTEYIITVPVWFAREMPTGKSFTFRPTEDGFEYRLSASDTETALPGWMRKDA